MNRPDDRIIYIIFIAAMTAVAILATSISLYSRLTVEPRVINLLAEADNDAGNLNRAYILLREPQLFAGYKYWDSEGIPARNSLRYFDNKLFNGRDISPGEKPYLELLLNRRQAGSTLGLKTGFFFFIFAITGAAAFFFNRRNSR